MARSKVSSKRVTPKANCSSSTRISRKAKSVAGSALSQKHRNGKRGPGTNSTGPRKS